MKRHVLIRHLEAHGCYLLREGGGHSIYKNSANGRQTAVPRHPEIDRHLIRKICKDLGIPPP